MQQPVGQHLIIDAWEASPDLLDDPVVAEAALREAVAASGASLIDLCVHRFSPHGVTATATLAESHLALHTWPEHGYFAADLFFCGAGDPQAAVEVLRRGFAAGRVESRSISRGIPG